MPFRFDSVRTEQALMLVLVQFTLQLGPFLLPPWLFDFLVTSHHRLQNQQVPSHRPLLQRIGTGFQVAYKSRHSFRRCQILPTFTQAHIDHRDVFQLIQFSFQLLAFMNKKVIELFSKVSVGAFVSTLLQQLALLLAIILNLFDQRCVVEGLIQFGIGGQRALVLHLLKSRRRLLSALFLLLFCLHLYFLHKALLLMSQNLHQLCMILIFRIQSVVIHRQGVNALYFSMSLILRFHAKDSFLVFLFTTISNDSSPKLTKAK